MECAAVYLQSTPNQHHNFQRILTTFFLTAWCIHPFTIITISSSLSSRHSDNIGKYSESRTMHSLWSAWITNRRILTPAFLTSILDSFSQSFKIEWFNDFYSCSLLAVTARVMNHPLRPPWSPFHINWIRIWK